MMKTIKLETFTRAALVALLLAQPLKSFGQTPLQFTGINTTPENAIQFH